MAGRASGRRLGRRPTARRDRAVRSSGPIDDYLAYLHVERGLAPATIRAYRGDLDGLRRASLRDGRRAGRARRTPAVRYLAARTPPRPAAGTTGLAPTSLRRRAAALKGFYRFAFGEGLIDVDVAAHLDLPRQSRRLPDTLDVAEVERAARGGVEPAALRDRALLELLYAAGLRVSEALGLDREDLSLDGAFVRVIGKGDKERLVPVGEVALDWLDRVARRPAAGARSRGITSRRSAAARCSSAIGAAARPAAGVGGRDRPRRRGPASAAGSARTRCGTRSRRTCSRAAPTCGSSRSCSDMRVSPRPSCTRT